VVGAGGFEPPTSNFLPDVVTRERWCSSH